MTIHELFQTEHQAIRKMAADLRELTLRLGTEMLMMAHEAPGAAAARTHAATALAASRSAFQFQANSSWS